MTWKAILIIFLFLLPTQLGRHFWPQEAFIFGLKVDYLSPTLYLQDILIFLLLVSFDWRKWWELSKKLFHCQKRLILASLYVVISLVNILASPTPLVSAFIWLRVTELLLLGILLAQNSRRIFNLAGKIFPWLIIAEFFLGLGQFLRQSSFNGLFWFLGERSFNIFTPGIARSSWLGEVALRPYGTFSHPNSLAGFVLVAAILFHGKEKLNLLDKLALVAGMALIFLTFSRTVWLAFFLLGLAYLIYRLKHSWVKNCSNLSFPYLILLISLPLVAYIFNRTAQDFSSVVIRRDLAAFSLSLIKESPLFGVGAGRFIVNLSQNRPDWQWLYWLQPVHNIYLLIASEAGLVGLALFLFLIFKAFVSLSNQVNASHLKEKKMYWSLRAALAVILFTGLFDHYWLTLIQNQLLFTLVLALSLGPLESQLSSGRG